MSTPEPLLKREIADPLPRMQNVALTVEPPGWEAIEHHQGFSFVSGSQMRAMSTWSWPWWLTDRMTGYGSGAYGAGPYGQAANQGEYGALRYGRGKYGTGGYL